MQPTTLSIQVHRCWQLGWKSSPCWYTRPLNSQGKPWDSAVNKHTQNRKQSCEERPWNLIGHSKKNLRTQTQLIHYSLYDQTVQRSVLSKREDFMISCFLKNLKGYASDFVWHFHIKKKNGQNVCNTCRIIRSVPTIDLSP